MKISLINTSYPTWVKYIYERNPNLKTSSFNEQKEFLHKQYAGAFFSFFHYLNELGHETQLILPDIEYLQKKWNQEKGIIENENWEYNVALKQLQSFNPDIVYASCQNNYMGDFYGKVKEITGKKLVVWFSSPIRPSHDFRNIDHIVSSSDQFVATFKKMGIDSTLLKAGFDPNVLQVLQKKEEFVDSVSFVGSLSGHHSKREELLRNLKAENIDFSLYGNGLNKSLIGRLKDLYNAKTQKAEFLKKVFFKSPYSSNFKKEVFGLDMYQTLMDSKIIINSHIDAANGMVGNMRMYETTGVGTCLVNDNGYNLKELFEPDYEIVVYNSAAEAAEKIKWLLNNDKEREKIAIEGQKRTFKNHNYKDRAIEFEGILKKLV